MLSNLIDHNPTGLLINRVGALDGGGVSMSHVDFSKRQFKFLINVNVTCISGVQQTSIFQSCQLSPTSVAFG